MVLCSAAPGNKLKGWVVCISFREPRPRHVLQSPSLGCPGSTHPALPPKDPPRSPADSPLGALLTHCRAGGHGATPGPSSPHGTPVRQLRPGTPPCGSWAALLPLGLSSWGPWGGEPPALRPPPGSRAHWAREEGAARGRFLGGLITWIQRHLKAQLWVPHEGRRPLPSLAASVYFAVGFGLS